MAVAQKLMQQADGPQLGVLIEELPSLFAGSDTSWIEPTLRSVDSELADAAANVRTATQAAQMSNWAAAQVRKGFASGTPPVSIGMLAEAVPRYDPDAS